MVQAGDPAARWGDLLILNENRSAIRAAERVARALERPSGRTTSASPLLLHGPPGVGKSAIVQSLIRRVSTAAATRTVRILTATEFPRSSDESSDELSDLRSADLLVLEDVHYLKEPDFNTVRGVLDYRAARRRPTIVTAPSGPANLTALPRRLTSRLGSGLVVRIDPPAVESRLLLARSHADKRKVKIQRDALAWLAETASGIRPLFGMVEKLRTVHRGQAGRLDLDRVRELLQEPAADDSPLDRIIAKVCEVYRLKRKELTGPSRLRTVLVPRQVAMYLAREVAKLPLVQIGQQFGGRDHTTVLNALRKLESLLKSDAQLAATVQELRLGIG